MIHCHKSKTKIFLETSEQKMGSKEFEEALIILKDEKSFDKYLEIIKKVIKKPVILNMNFGNTAPIYTIPYGGNIKLNFPSKEIIILK